MANTGSMHGAGEATATVVSHPPPYNVVDADARVDDRADDGPTMERTFR